MLGSCCARKPRTAPSQRKHQGARCAATWAGTNIFAYVIVVLGHVCYCCFSRVFLLLSETVYVIVVLGPVSYCWFWYCCFGPCLFLLFEVVFAIVALLLWGEAKVQGTLYLVKEIYVRIFCAGKRRGTARCQSPRSTSRSTAGSNCQNRIPPIPLHSTYPCLYLWQRQCVDKCIYTIVQHICQGGGLLEFSAQ